MYDAVYLLAQALEQYDQTTILRPFNASCENPVHWTSGRTLYTYLNQVGRTLTITIYFIQPSGKLKLSFDRTVKNIVILSHETHAHTHS